MADIRVLSERPDVHYMRWTDSGLSTNRNHALRAATGEVCLIADDDLEFLPGWQDAVTAAFAARPDAAFMTFASLRAEGGRRKISSPTMRQHDRASVFDVSSVEIAFRLDAVRGMGIEFDERIGLGGRIGMGEEVLFLRHLLERGASGWSAPTPIVRHLTAASTGERAMIDLRSPEVRAMGALQFCARGPRVFLWIPRQAAFLALSRGRWWRAPRLAWDLTHGAAYAARTGLCHPPAQR